MTEPLGTITWRNKDYPLTCDTNSTRGPAVTVSIPMDYLRREYMVHLTFYRYRPPGLVSRFWEVSHVTSLTPPERDPTARFYDTIYTVAAYLRTRLPTDIWEQEAAGYHAYLQALFADELHAVAAYAAAIPELAPVAATTLATQDEVSQQVHTWFQEYPHDIRHRIRGLQYVGEQHSRRIYGIEASQQSLQHLTDSHAKGEICDRCFALELKGFHPGPPRQWQYGPPKQWPKIPPPPLDGCDHCPLDARQ